MNIYTRQLQPDQRDQSDLGSQLEDLLTHVFKCEKWARFDDRLDLAMAVERNKPRQ